MMPFEHPPAPPPAVRRILDSQNGVSRFDMAMGLACLFRPALPRYERIWREGSEQRWGSGHVSFTGPELDAFDAAVLLGLAAIALEHEPNLSESKETGILVEAENVPDGKMTDANLASVKSSAVVHTSMTHLAHAIGRKRADGRTCKDIRRSLKRLSSVVLYAEIEDGQKWAMSHLVSGAIGKGRGAIKVALNWRATEALLGEGSSYGRVRLSLWVSSKPVARVLWLWLATWFGALYVSRKINLARLVEHIWGEPGNDATYRDRVRQVRRALSSLPSDEWSASTDGHMVTITRKNPNACS